jgi:hypothetical protein
VHQRIALCGNLRQRTAIVGAPHDGTVLKRFGQGSRRDQNEQK